MICDWRVGVGDCDLWLVFGDRWLVVGDLWLVNCECDWWFVILSCECGWRLGFVMFNVEFMFGYRNMWSARVVTCAWWFACGVLWVVVGGRVVWCAMLDVITDHNVTMVSGYDDRGRVIGGRWSVMYECVAIGGYGWSVWVCDMWCWIDVWAVRIGDV